MSLYGLGSHGLVGLGPAGEQINKIRGHEFGRHEIVAKIEDVLKKTAD